MAKIGGFDPGLGITQLRDGAQEIGRGNLPVSERLLPGSVAVSFSEAAGVFGRLTDSALAERFAPYLSTEVRHRELLSPDVFFETLGSAADELTRMAVECGDGGERFSEAAGIVRETLSDRALCEMLRNLVIKA